MWFKNPKIYRLSADFDATGLDDRLEVFPNVPNILRSLGLIPQPAFPPYPMGSSLPAPRSSISGFTC